MSRLFVMCALTVAGACALGACATGGEGDPDGAAGPDAPPAIDAPPGAADGGPDGAGGMPTAIVEVSPQVVTLARGATAEVTVTLDAPAAAGGAEVTLDAPSDPGMAVVGFPPALTIPEGAAEASFTVTAIGAGGPLDVRASFRGTVDWSSVRVIPALVSLSPPATDVVAGATVTYTVMLEGPVDATAAIALESSAPAVLSVPASVNVGGGASSATFGATASATLGGPITIAASVGIGGGVTATARVVGVYMSEVFYDVSGTDDMKEWIELWNGAPVAIDLAGMRVQVDNNGSGYDDVLTLAGTLTPGQCAVLGGPMSGAAAMNFTPDGFVYLVAGDFSTDLGNAGSATGDPGDGLSLVTASGAVVDNVIYGRDNADLILDENGVAPAAPDVGDAPAAQSIERTAPGLAGPWTIQIAPNPGNCTPVSM
jgi:hypothetical protein